MVDCVWSDSDIIWNNNPYLWNVCEIIAEIVPEEESKRGGLFYLKSRLRNSKNTKFRKIEDVENEKYIKILCIVNDEKFEKWKYINKRIKIQSFDESLIIRDIKKVNISEDNVKFEMIPFDDKESELKIENKEIKIEIKNIKIT